MSIFCRGGSRISELKLLVFKTRSGKQCTLCQVSIPSRSSRTDKEAQKQYALNALIIPVPSGNARPEMLSDWKTAGVTIFSDLEALYLPPIIPAKKTKVQDDKSKKKADDDSDDENDDSTAHFRPISFTSSLKELKRSTINISDETMKTLETHYTLGFSFFICEFDISKGVKENTIGYLHDLYEDYFVPLLQQPFRSSADQIEGAVENKATVFILNAQAHRGAGISCMKTTREIKKALTLSVLEPYLPRSLNLRQLKFHGGHENEDLFIPIDLSAALDDNVYVAIKDLQVIAIDTDKQKVTLPSTKQCQILTVQYKEELTSTMYALTRKIENKAEPYISVHLSYKLSELLAIVRVDNPAAFIDELNEQDLKNLLIQVLVCSSEGHNIIYQLSIVDRN